MDWDVVVPGDSATVITPLVQQSGLSEDSNNVWIGALCSLTGLWRFKCVGYSIDVIAGSVIYH